MAVITGAAAGHSTGQPSTGQPPLGAAASTAFPLLPGEASLPLRLMTDLGSIEIFAAGGRGVFSGGLSYAACELVSCQITLAALPSAGVPPAVLLAAGAAWKMGSIYA